MTDIAERPADGRWAGLAALIGGACIIACAPILVRLTGAGPAATGFWRMAFALPILAAMNARAARDAFAPPGRAALIAGAMFALDLVFWHYGIALTSVANATVLANLTPLIVTAIAWIVFKQRPERMFLLAVVVAVSGAWIMAAAKGGAPGKAPLIGDLSSAATALWYALYMLAVGRARRTDGAMRVMFWSTLSALPILVAAALIMRERLLPLGLGGWAACLGLGVVHVSGQGAIAWALGRLPASTASVVVLVQPVVAALLGWMLFGEMLGPWQAVGGAVALAGIVLAQWASRPAKAQAA
ncbi:DMT family transporter [Phenylobacterium sp.]|uniref:DMT family transporter n=1 Tax=Phenylobacterium sp. TaxID=1871053 RepID=UPI0035B42096